MKYYLIFIFFLWLNSPLFGQVKSPGEFFPEQRASVFIVGSFHMDYPDLDAYVTSETNKIDVLKEPKRSELTELVGYIKKFQPNKIAIEATPRWNAVEKLEKYKKGEYRNERDERFQIGIRIADDLNLDTLYSVDSWSVALDLKGLDSTYTAKLFEDYDYASEDPFSKMTFEWYSYDDKLASKMNLLAYFTHINSREYHNYMNGAYLVGDFKLGEYRGADALSVMWYNRNLRIFRNIQRITNSPEDRIMVLMGNGHAAILRLLFESSPEYEFIEFGSLN